MTIKDGLGTLFRRTRRTARAPAAGHPHPLGLEPLEPRLQLSSPEVDAVPAPAPDELLPDLIPWASRENGFIYGWHLDRSSRTGKTVLRLTTAMANIGEGPLELRGGDAVEGGQEVYQRVYTADGKFRDRLAGIFRYHPTHSHTHFDNFAVYRLRHMTADEGVGRAVKAGNKVSFCLTDSDGYDLSLPGAPANGKYFACGTRRQGISVGWSDIYDETLPDQWINVTGVEPGRYWLEVVVDPKDHVLETNEKNNVARIPITLRDPSPPDNDDFARATALKGYKAVARSSNDQATREKGEPRHAGGSGGASVWWSWTAGTTGTVSISTRGSEFDTLLGVYKGSSLEDLNVVASSDDARGEVTSRVTFTAKKGVTYRIAVDGYQGATGDVRLVVKQEA